MKSKFPAIYSIFMGASVVGIWAKSVNLASLFMMVYSVLNAAVYYAGKEDITVMIMF